jgi:hypothetical protein
LADPPSPVAETSSPATVIDPNRPLIDDIPDPFAE